MMETENAEKTKGSINDVCLQSDLTELIKGGSNLYKNLKSSLISEAQRHISSIEEDDYNLIVAQKDLKLTASATHDVFRKFERNQYNIWILQYLISFQSKLPLEKDIENDPANPFEQFKSFIIHNINLLNQDDVIQSIIRQLKKSGMCKKIHLQYYRWWIVKIFKEIQMATRSARKPVLEGWKQLLSSLQCLCLFWFSVKNQDMRLIRKGDLYMYLLAQNLLNKIKSSAE